MESLGNRVKEEEIVEGMQAETKDESEEAGENVEEHEHAEAHEHEHHHHEEEVENDEHIWLSLKNTIILVNALAESLGKLDPSNAAIYKMNGAMYAAKLYNGK